MSIPVAVQLYTLRDALKEDFMGTLEKVAKIGYQGVEFAGFGGFDALELKEKLETLNLKPAGAHISLDELKNNLQEIIKYNLQLGNKYIVCPWASFTKREDYIDLAKTLDNIGKELKEADLQLCYHNHAHELELYDGAYALDLLFNQVDSEYLKAEIDTYWVTYAGLDAIEYMKKYSGRTPLIHIKDMAATKEKEFTEIGNGTIDIKAISEQAKNNGAQWLIVEQDICKINPLDSVKISFDNLKKMNEIIERV